MRFSTSEKVFASAAATMLVLLACATPSTLAAEVGPPQEQSADKTSAQERAARQTERFTPPVVIFRQASPAVVNLSTTSVVTVQDAFGFGPLFEDIFEMPFSRRPRRYEKHSVGSGFLIHSDGYLVTNAHVVDRVSECKVVFADGKELPATVVAIEPKDDLAILKVESDHPLPAIKLGRSDDLMPGETVIAIGNPLGYQHTITTGIISALNRELRFGRDRVYSGLIQVDAPINPGNSGGPLLNVLGELIGINTAIRGDAQNIGFAIPVDRLRELLPIMLDLQRLRRVQFGLHFAGDGAHPGGRGVAIATVDPDSPGAKAGLRQGDVVTAINGKSTTSFMDAFSALERAPTDGKLAMDLLRGGERKSVEVQLVEVPLPDGAKLIWELFGVRVRELTQEDMQQLGLRQRIGLVVTEVDRRSQAHKEGVAQADLITRIGGRPVTGLAALGNLLEQVRRGDRVPIGVWRIGDDAIIQVELPLQAQ